MKTARTAKSAFFTVSAFVLAFMAQSAQATIVVDNTGAGPTICSPASVTLANSAPPAGNTADYCIGYIPSPGNPTAEKTELNSRTDGSDWTFAYKAEDPPEPGDLLGGIEFTLTDVDIDAVSGSWTITWEDTNGTDPYNLPLYVDLAVGFKAGSAQSDAGIAYFLFDDYLLTDDPYQAIGTFTLTVEKGLSHESLFVRYESEPRLPPNEEIPEPGMLFLMGAGLLGLGMARRRKTA